ncbi:MAG: ribonuclease Y [Firmicutes bacterium]|nr:ribonuclease Y [Bacillota bacterium]
MVPIIITAAVTAVIVAVIVWFVATGIQQSKYKATVGSAEERSRAIIDDALKTAESKKREVLLEAKEENLKAQNELEKEIKERRSELSRMEKRAVNKEETLDRKTSILEKREAGLNAKEESLNRKHAKADELTAQISQELERVSGMTSEQAKEFLFKSVENEVKLDTAKMIKEMEAKAKDEASAKAREYVVTAIQRCAADHVAETTISVVQLPNDEMKGRIIGREGRNIRTLETLTGVELIIDDTPEAVVLSSFDPMRREVARIALEKLILDGRIHPARIEEMVEKAEREVNATIKEEGEQAAFEVGIHNLHPELIKLLGRLKYRTSYGQNVLKHSVEVAHLAGLMAGELGLDIKLAKRAGLLHDIGKALDHEVEGTHVDIGIDVLKKYKESDAVINGMAAHHGDYEPKSMEAVLIAAADALSAARPGARRETLDAYIKRLEKLEEIANTTPGVEKSFAIQAGREIRIIAKPEDVNDEEIVFLAREISKKIESELEYPGQIKVNVVRETRAIDYAK